MRWMLALAILTACCGDNTTAPDAPIDARPDAPRDAVYGDLFGEPCVQPPFPTIGGCRPDASPGGFQGACNDEAGGSVCRPWCHLNGVPDCERRMGVEFNTDRGACVCVPR